MGIGLLPSIRAFSTSHGSRTSSKVNFSPRLSMALTCPALISKSIGQPSAFSTQHSADQANRDWLNAELLIAECLISKIRLRGIRVLLNAQVVYTARAQLVHICAAICDSINPAFQPGIAVCIGLRLLVVLAEECIVTLVVSLHRRGMRAVGTLDHRIHQEPRNHGAIRIAGYDLRLNHLFCDDDHALGRTNSLDHHAEVAPAVRIAFAVGTLHVNDGDIRTQRAYRPQRLLLRKRRKYPIEKMISLGHVAAQRGSRRKERHAHGSRL